MALLKICTITRTQWLPDVRSVERLASFDTPTEYRDVGGDGLAISRKLTIGKEKSILEAAVACGVYMGSGIQLAEFGNENVGVVLRVKQHGCEDKIWIVPDRSCFLLSEEGKTLDRI